MSKQKQSKQEVKEMLEMYLFYYITLPNSQRKTERKKDKNLYVGLLLVCLSALPLS